MLRDPLDSGPVSRSDLPPADVTAEAGVIASCLLDNDKIHDAAEVLPDESMFFRESHARLWRIILDFYAEGKPADGVTVAPECERRGFGFGDGLSPGDAVAEMLAGPDLSWDAVTYALSVRRTGQLRDAIETAEAILRDAYRNRDEPEAVVARAFDRIARFQAEGLTGSTETLGSLVPGVIERMRSRQDNKPTGILTPWAELNSLTDGLQSTDFMIVAGRPSMGKTSYGLNMADHAATDWRVPTLFISLEMSNPLLAERMLVARAKVDGHAARTGRLDQDSWGRIDRARADLLTTPVHLVRRPGRTLAEVVAEVRRAVARHKVGLVIVDYIQLIRSDNPRETEVQALTRISGDLKGLTKQLNVPVVALSQLNRNLESRDDKRPKMADIRGSGSIENDADLIVLLHRHEYFNPGEKEGVAEVILGKNRNGPPGEFTLRFVKDQMRFDNHYPDDGCVPDGPAF